MKVLAVNEMRNLVSETVHAETVGGDLSLEQYSAFFYYYPQVVVSFNRFRVHQNEVVSHQKTEGNSIGRRVM